MGRKAGSCPSSTDVHESAAEAQASILQALMMMNGRLVEEATSPARSRTLAAVLGGTSKTAGQAIDELYLAALSRPPRPEERDRLVAYVEAGDRAGLYATSSGRCSTGPNSP